MKQKLFTEKAQLEIEVEEQERIEAARIAKEKRLISQAKQLIKQKNSLLFSIKEIDEKLEKINEGEEADMYTLLSISINSGIIKSADMFINNGIANTANFKC